MSSLTVNRLNWALKSDIKRNLKSTLLALAILANDQHQVEIKRNELISYLKISRPQLRRNLIHLENMGFISIKHRFDNNKPIANIYTLIV